MNEAENETPAPQSAPSPTIVRVPPHGEWVVKVYDATDRMIAQGATEPGAELRVVIEEA